jgi:fatty-acyl-CoA synthase
VLLTDREFSPTIAAALAKVASKPLIVDVLDPEHKGPGDALGTLDYEQLLAGGDPSYPWQPPSDEWNAIALSYTSGTTGNPKGVVTHHRGAYLNALANALHWNLPRHPGLPVDAADVPLQRLVLPLDHRSGCRRQRVPAQGRGGGDLRSDPRAPRDALLRRADRPHHADQRPGRDAPRHRHRVSAFVAGAAPPAAMIEGMSRIGFDVTHVYGLTEVYGPAAVCAKHDEWESLDVDRRAERNGRQGVRYVLQEGMTVMDPATMKEVPADGQTVGEIMFRGNITMKGYLKNPKATREAFAGGWFHSGDLAVLQPDRYAKIRDRSKDIIISGGENISSLEVEDAIYRHPSVLAAAWWRSPTRSGASRRARSSSSSRVRAPPKRRSSSTAAACSRASSARDAWCSACCPRRRPGRSRSSCCASA